MSPRKHLRSQSHSTLFSNSALATKFIKCGVRPLFFVLFSSSQLIMIMTKVSDPPGYLSPTSRPKFSGSPPHATVGMLPELNKVVKMEHCYYYLSLIERFWRLMDAMTKNQQRLYLARAEFRYELWINASAKTHNLTPPIGKPFPLFTHSSFIVCHTLTIRCCLCVAYSYAITIPVP